MARTDGARAARREVRRDDESSIEYRVVGAGPPVVFVRGIWHEAESWKPQVAGLASELRLICPDLGHDGISAAGASAGASTIHIDAFVADLQLVLERALDGRGAHICGNSLGGVIAVHLATVVPELVTSIVLCGGWTFGPAGDEVDAPGGDADRSSTGALGDLGDASGPLPLSSDAPPAVTGDAVVAAPQAMWPSNGRDQCGLVAQPALVIVGERDRVASPTGSDELAAALHDAPIAVIAGAGHRPHLEKPFEFNRILLDWVTTVEVGLNSPSADGGDSLRGTRS